MIAPLLGRPGVIFKTCFGSKYSKDKICIFSDENTFPLAEPSPVEELS